MPKWSEIIETDEYRNQSYSDKVREFDGYVASLNEFEESLPGFVPSVDGKSLSDWADVERSKIKKGKIEAAKDFGKEVGKSVVYGLGSTALGVVEEITHQVATAGGTVPGNPNEQEERFYNKTNEQKLSEDSRDLARVWLEGKTKKYLKSFTDTLTSERDFHGAPGEKMFQREGTEQVDMRSDRTKAQEEVERIRISLSKKLKNREYKNVDEYASLIESETNKVIDLAASIHGEDVSTYEYKKILNNEENQILLSAFSQTRNEDYLIAMFHNLTRSNVAKSEDDRYEKALEASGIDPNGWYAEFSQYADPIEAVATGVELAISGGVITAERKLSSSLAKRGIRAGKAISINTVTEMATEYIQEVGDNPFATEGEKNAAMTMAAKQTIFTSLMGFGVGGISNVLKNRTERVKIAKELGITNSEAKKLLDSIESSNKKESDIETRDIEAKSKNERTKDSETESDLKSLTDEDLVTIIDSEPESTLKSSLNDIITDQENTLKGKNVRVNEVSGDVPINEKEVVSGELTDTERKIFFKEVEIKTKSYLKDVKFDDSLTDSQKKYLGAIVQNKIAKITGQEKINLPPLENKAKLDSAVKVAEAKAEKTFKAFKAKSELAILKERAKSEKKLSEEREKRENLNERKDQAIKEVEFRATKKLNDVKKKLSDQKFSRTDAISEVDEIVKTLPRAIRGKFPTSFFKDISKKDSVKAMDRKITKAVDKVQEIFEDYKKNKYTDRAKSIIERGVKAAKRRGEFEGFKQIKEISEMDSDSLESREALLSSKKDLTESEEYEYGLIKILGGILNKESLHDSVQAEAAMKEVDSFIKKGRSAYKDRMDGQKKRNLNRNEQTVATMLPEGGLMSTRELDRRQRGLRGLLADSESFFFGRMDGWETMLDNLAGKGKRFKTFLHKTFYRPAFNAQAKEETSNRRDMVEWGEAVIEAVGSVNTHKDMLKLSKEWSTRNKDSGIIYKSEGKLQEQDLSKWEAISIWMQWQDKTLTPSFEKMGIDEKTIDSVERFITNDGISVGRYMLDQYISKGKRFQFEVNKVDGYVPGVVTNYSPIVRRRSDGVVVDALDATNMNDYVVQTAKNASMKERSSNTLELDFKPANEAFMQHTYAMNHFYAWGQVAKDMRNTFSDPSVRRAVRQVSGTKQTLHLVDTIIDDMLRGGIDKAKTHKVMTEIISNLAVSKLALNLPSALKQLGSIPAYADAMPAGQWAKYATKFWLPDGRFSERIKTITESEYIKDRISNGYERDIKQLAAKGVDRALAGVRTKRDKLMILTRLGDVGAIVAGGWPVYQYTYDQAVKAGKTTQEAHEEAIQEFSEATDRSQQSAKIFSLGHWQRGGAFTKMFTMFMTTPIQYMRITTNAIKAMRKGRISKIEAAKTVFIYHVLLPQIFVAMGSGMWSLFDDDDEKQKKFRDRHLASLFTGNFNSIFLAGGMIDGFTGTVLSGGKETFLSDQSNPLLDSMEKLVRGSVKMVLSEDGDEFIDGLDKSASGLLSGFGIPYDPFMNYADGVMETIDGTADNPYLRLMGFTDYAIGEDDKESTSTEKKSTFTN